VDCLIERPNSSRIFHYRTRREGRKRTPAPDDGDVIKHQMQVCCVHGFTFGLCVCVRGNETAIKVQFLTDRLDK
jgi:hypothetical protein